MTTTTQASPPALHAGMALFQDFDGSLVEIAPEPGAVDVTPALCAVLDGIQQFLGGAFAIVSGRRLADIDRFFPAARFAGAGIHGAELRRAGGAEIEDGLEALAQGVAGALRLHFADDPRILVEDK